MSAEIKIDKRSVKMFLKNEDEPICEGFLIPAYQRPYAWGEDQVITLFDDIWEFAIGEGGFKNKNATYFLGSIVLYKNEERKVLEIIDGQQRMTSFCLLLRACYTKLEHEDDDQAKHLCHQIEEALWTQDIETGKVDKKQPRFTSDVISDEGNKIISEILSTGVASDKARDRYSLNYRKFQELIERNAKAHPLCLGNFIHAVLNQAIVLPITAAKQDTALTIFSTLNNRGLPLSDADIFKANLYSHQGNDPNACGAFIKLWQALEERAERVGETMQSLFNYAMFVLRARNGDHKTTTPGVRKYFLDEKTKMIYTPGLLDLIGSILDLCEVVNKWIKHEDEPWTADMGILKQVDILKAYPNEFWKYPVIMFYVTHHENTEFQTAFQVFLKRLTALIVLRYIKSPTVNAIKGDVLKLNEAIQDSIRPSFPEPDMKDINSPELVQQLIEPHPKIVRMLLKRLAYQKQNELLPADWEIEHILPQKWEKGYFKASDEEVRKKVEHLGNKMPLEKLNNIRASNGFFSKKLEEYKTSKIAIVKDVMLYQKWGLDEIGIRDVRVADDIISSFTAWVGEYVAGD